MISIAATPRRTFSSREEKPSVSNSRSLIASLENIGMPSCFDRYAAIVLLPVAGRPQTRIHTIFLSPYSVSLSIAHCLAAFTAVGSGSAASS